MPVVKATVHGAISIVNAIATGKGSTLGISKNIDVVIETSQGHGITTETNGKLLRSRLINRVIDKKVPKKELRSQDNHGRNLSRHHWRLYSPS